MWDETKPLLEVLPDQMTSKTHTLLIQGYAYGQFRIQLTRLGGLEDRTAPPGHGSIVRELCTYSGQTAGSVALLLRLSSDPEGACELLAKPWNCEYPGGRIRLDNTKPLFTCPRCGAESHNPNDAREQYCARCNAFVGDEGTTQC